MATQTNTEKIKQYKVHLKSYVRVLKIKNRRSNIFWEKYRPSYQALGNHFDVVFMGKHEINYQTQFSQAVRTCDWPNKNP